MSKLELIVRSFIDAQGITCSETIYQTDRVIENAYEFIERLCDEVGYAVSDDRPVELTNPDELPWSDCKVAFGAEDSEAIWEAWEAGVFDRRLPPGWSLNETDGAGARLVVVFRVEGPLHVEDGALVQQLVAEIEASHQGGEGHE